MSEATIDFIDRLIDNYPSLRPIFDQHVSDNSGEVLPHLFFGDLTRYVVSRFLKVEAGKEHDGVDAETELRRLLNDLEEAYATGDEEIQELISVSFLENLPRPDEAAARLRAWLGPQLSGQLRVIG